MNSYFNFVKLILVLQSFGVIWMNAENLQQNSTERIYVLVFYETLCHDCREFFTKNLTETAQELKNYIIIYIHPYGMTKIVEKDNMYSFVCHHGEAECYGNKLHACALYKVRDQTKALLYNSCMMSLKFVNGSDDHAADECGRSMGIHSGPIKECAKGDGGTSLLYMYSYLSHKYNYTYLPYVIINRKEKKRNEDLKKSICAAFKNPPPPCKV